MHFELIALSVMSEAVLRCQNYIVCFKLACFAVGLFF